MKQLLKIRAKTNKDIGVDLEFKSIAEAKFFNPDLHDFEIVGNKDKKIKLDRWIKWKKKN